MKKIVVALAALFIAAVLFSSCAPKHCAAYGETYKYQKDRRH